LGERIGEIMALSSPSHRFGQIIGDILEETMIEYLLPIAEKYSLFLDYRHARNARGGKKEVRWVDINGNTHKLDIVMEKDGDENRIGEPRVFIEIAWRRYTKHSKNKAQEISGAIAPLIAKYSKSTPFFGAIIAGVFTQSSIDQMTSEGFDVVYIPLETIKNAFAVAGIDTHWEEDTHESELQAKVDAFERLGDESKKKIKTELVRLTNNQLEEFRMRLCSSLEREIESIRAISIYGEDSTFVDTQQACHFIATFNETPSQAKFLKFEIFVRYSNGDKMDIQFSDRAKAVSFLKSLG